MNGRSAVDRILKHFIFKRIVFINVAAISGVNGYISRYGNGARGIDKRNDRAVKFELVN